MICDRCSQDLPDDLFPVKRTGRRSKKWCIECRKEYAEESKIRVEEYGKSYRQENKEQLRNKKLLKTYGIDIEYYNKMLLDQDGKCAICNTSADSLVVDHCHTTGQVRGLLCHHCNSGLGMFRDNPEVMLRAINYLQQHKNQ